MPLGLLLRQILGDIIFLLTEGPEPRDNLSLFRLEAVKDKGVLSVDLHPLYGDNSLHLGIQFPHFPECFRHLRSGKL